LDALKDFALGGWGEVTVFDCAWGRRREKRRSGE
jgi:hypothetical protein